MSHCKVRLLDESDIEIGVDLHGNGQELLESVCKYLDIIEMDYFGLKYKGANYEGLWIRTDKPIKKQYPIHPAAWEFTFAVRYYPTDPVYLKEEITKYQLCLQIREDLMRGKLQCPLETLVTLSSYWLQSEFGDDEQQSSEVKKYLMSLKYIPGAERPTPEFEEKVEKLYKSRRGMPPSDADTQFLRLAAALPMYGLHRYETENKDGVKITVAIGSAGVFLMKGKEKPVKHKWVSIKNINYKKETFYIKLLSQKKHGHSEKLIFHVKSPLFAKAMWREAVDQHVFFRVTRSVTSSTGKISSPQTKKNKGISKRKRKLSFKLSFRKKRPKNEAEVREESSKIKRPNPTVIRHSSLKRSSSVKSEPSTNSFDSSTASESKSPRTPPLKSILKHQHLSKEDEDSDEVDGRPFTNDDFVIEETSDGEDVHPNSTLLLTETIPEEDEEEAERRSTASKELKKSPIATPTRESLPSNDNLDTPMVVVSSAEEVPEKKIVRPKVTVEMIDEPRKLSVDLRPNSSGSEFLPPPLVSQSTREAIIPYYQEEKRAVDEPAVSAMAEEVLEANYVQEHNKKEMKREDTEQEDNTPSEKSKTSFPDLELPVNNGGKTDDEEDDRRTIGAASAVAVLGDDEDANMKDLVDDVTNFFTDYDKVRFRAMEQSQDETESRITESSDSSISNLTDNTDELCSPNILEIIWSKCSGKKEYGYREIFGVKLRKVRGRSRQYKSTVFDVDNYHTVGTQVPTPPPADDSAVKSQSSNFTYSSGNKFIPSWPFDPDSLASNTELDELDKEAIKAALRAQQELKEDLDGLDDISTSDKQLLTNVEEKKEKLKDLSCDTVLEIPLQRADSIPGIPLFCRSVLKSFTDSNTSSRRDSNASSIPSTTQKETLVYPPDIQTYQSTVLQDIEMLKYQPKIDSLKEMKESADVVSNDAEKSQLFVAKDKTKMEVSNQTEAHVFSDLHKQRLEASGDSGRSTPSSDTSFPRFIHSVYPLRKMSTNWGSETASSQDNLSDKADLPTMTEENSDQESSTTVSNCSIKSVRGSTSSEESFEDPPESNVFPASPLTEVTVIELINETILENGDKEITIREEVTETTQQMAIADEKYNGTIEDYSEEAMVDSDEPSTTDTTSSSTLPYEKLDSNTVSQDAADSLMDNQNSESFPENPSVSDNLSSSAESCISSDRTNDNWADLSLDLSEIIPTAGGGDGPVNDSSENRSSLPTQKAEPEQLFNQVQDQDEEMSSESTGKREENELPEDEQEQDEMEEGEIVGCSGCPNPVIVISSERSESDEINDTSDESTTTSSNSQDTCEYDFNPTLDGEREQPDETPQPNDGGKDVELE